MRVRLGIATTFAVKRWPRPADWAPIVHERLGLRLVQHTLDLVEPPLGVGSVVTRSGAVRRAIADHDLEIHSTITGRAAAARCMLLHPDPEVRTEARLSFHRAIAFTERVGGIATGGHLGALAVGRRRRRRGDRRPLARRPGGPHVARHRRPPGRP